MWAPGTRSTSRSSCAAETSRPSAGGPTRIRARGRQPAPWARLKCYKTMAPSETELADSRPVKLGLLGTGFILNDFHLPALREVPGVQVTAVAGRTGGKTDAFARRWGIKKAYHGEGSIERLCRDPEVDAVLV